jgi:hyperosmotically inducible protein
MSNYEERRTIHEVSTGPRPPIAPAMPERVVVVEDNPGMSGLAIGVIVVAAIAATALVVYLIISNQQQGRDAQQAKDQTAQSQAAQVQNPPAQQQQQPPVIVTVPQSQPAAAPPVAAPAAPPSDANTAVSSENAGAELNSKLLHDRQLSEYTINANVDNGVATLSGTLPSDDLRMRAEQVAKSVKGVSLVINHINVQSND